MRTFCIAARLLPVIAYMLSTRSKSAPSDANSAPVPGEGTRTRMGSRWAAKIPASGTPSRTAKSTSASKVSPRTAHSAEARSSSVGSPSDGNSAVNVTDRGVSVSNGGELWTAAEAVGGLGRMLAKARKGSNAGAVCGAANATDRRAAPVPSAGIESVNVPVVSRTAPTSCPRKSSHSGGRPAAAVIPASSRTCRAMVMSSASDSVTANGWSRCSGAAPRRNGGSAIDGSPPDALSCSAGTSPDTAASVKAHCVPRSGTTEASGSTVDTRPEPSASHVHPAPSNAATSRMRQSAATSGNIHNCPEVSTASSSSTRAAVPDRCTRTEHCRSGSPAACGSRTTPPLCNRCAA